MKLFWQMYIWPKSFYITPKKQDKRKIVSIGRRFGKTRYTYHYIVESLPISDDEKKRLHEQYEKTLFCN